jgi:hypothetical protein
MRLTASMAWYVTRDHVSAKEIYMLQNCLQKPAADGNF